MLRGIADLLNGLALFLPFKVFVGVVVFVAVAAVPIWFETVRDKQIRGIIRRMIRADKDERSSLAASALDLAGKSPRRLGTLVRQAIHYDQRALRDEALAVLEATGKAPADVAHLRAMIAPKAAKFRDPIEATVRIEQLIEQGLHVAAREQLTAARASFPEDPDIAALERRLSEGSDSEPTG